MPHLAMFIDGWNFYYSLVSAGISPFGWCNFAQLARQQTGLPEATVRVKYFTSEDRPNPEKIDSRQKPIWWSALRCLGYEIVEGEFRTTHNEVEPHVRESGKRWREKQTDIALACHMVADRIVLQPDAAGSAGYRLTRGYDEAVLLSQDTDFVPAIRILAGAPFPRRVHVLFPPSAGSAEASAYSTWKRVSGPKVRLVQLTKEDLANALLPQVVTGPNGERIRCWDEWMWREKYERCQRRRDDTQTPWRSRSAAVGGP